jgi:hypothetical protein
MVQGHSSVKHPHDWHCMMWPSAVPAFRIPAYGATFASGSGRPAHPHAMMQFAMVQFAMMQFAIVQFATPQIGSSTIRQVSV